MWLEASTDDVTHCSWLNTFKSSIWVWSLSFLLIFQEEKKNYSRAQVYVFMVVCYCNFCVFILIQTSSYSVQSTTCVSQLLCMVSCIFTLMLLLTYSENDSKVAIFILNLKYSQSLCTSIVTEWTRQTLAFTGNLCRQPLRVQSDQKDILRVD